MSRDKRNDRLLHLTGIPRGFFLHRAADFTNENNGARPRISIEGPKRIECRRPDDRIAAYADEGRLPKAGSRQIEAHQRAETAAP